MKKIEIISLIYKSRKYLSHIENEFLSDRNKADGYDVSFRIVANDPTDEIKKELLLSNKPIIYDIYNDINPSEYYINRVYRCYNWAGLTSDADYLCFVNSDMIFYDGWLSNLMKHNNGVNIPCSRLVESGKMRSGLYGISKNFGQTVDDLKHSEFFSYAKEISFDTIKPGGLYMPFIISKEMFIASGMYPEGNLYKDGFGTCNGDVVASGDNCFFSKLHFLYGMKHTTVFDSLVYHVQEGEKSD